MSDTDLLVLGEVQALDLDWLLGVPDPADLDGELASATLIALGTDRRAAPDDRLPDPDSTDRRGWWADFEADVIWSAGPIGCRLWLLDRDTITGPEARRGATIARVETYIREGVQPFRDARICSAVSVRATRVGVERIDAGLTFHRGPLPALELRFAGLWSNIKA